MSTTTKLSTSGYERWFETPYAYVSRYVAGPGKDMSIIAFGASGVTGFNPYGMFVALFGSVTVLAAYHMLFQQRVSA